MKKGDNEKQLQLVGLEDSTHHIEAQSEHNRGVAEMTANRTHLHPSAVRGPVGMTATRYMCMGVFAGFMLLSIRCQRQIHTVAGPERHQEEGDAR